jgi:hypothetical protein
MLNISNEDDIVEPVVYRAIDVTADTTEDLEAHKDDLEDDVAEVKRLICRREDFVEDAEASVADIDDELERREDATVEEAV